MAHLGGNDNDGTQDERHGIKAQVEHWIQRSTVNADSIRRRQLLFSLLAASGSTSALLVGPTPVQAATDEVAPLPRKGSTKILKPPLDDREYETYEMTNGLRVLLCSDPSSNEAAGAMDVHVGASSDPVDIPGLAHFCEHMVSCVKCCQQVL
jgi:hypothetical protein